MTRIYSLFFSLALAFLMNTAWAGSVDINTADLAGLQTLTGIGPTRAAAIVDHRKQHGPFANIDELMQVKGIGPGIFSKISGELSVGKATAKKKPEAKKKADTKAKPDATKKADAKKKPDTKKKADAKAKPDAKKKADTKKNPETKKKVDAKPESETKSK